MCILTLRHSKISYELWVIFQLPTLDFHKIQIELLIQI